MDLNFFLFIDRVQYDVFKRCIEKNLFNDTKSGLHNSIAAQKFEVINVLDLLATSTTVTRTFLFLNFGRFSSTEKKYT